MDLIKRKKKEEEDTDIITQSIKKFHFSKASPMYTYEMKASWPETTQYISKRYKNIDSFFRIFRLFFIKNTISISYDLEFIEDGILNRIRDVPIAKFTTEDNGHSHLQLSRNELRFVFNDHFDCENRFIYISIQMFFGNTTVGHANLILIDQKMKTIERFEPYGYRHKITPSVMDEILKAILLLRFHDFKYLDVKDTNLPRCFQDLEQEETVANDLEESREIGGYCQAWCFFYLHMRIANPEMNQVDLLHGLIDEIKSFDNHSMINFIRSYARHVMFLLPTKLNFR